MALRFPGPEDVGAWKTKLSLMRSARSSNGWKTGWEIFQCLEKAAGTGSGLSGLRPQEGISNVKNLLLLVTRQFGNGLKNPLGPADRPAALLTVLRGLKQFLDGYAEHLRQLMQLIHADRDIPAFPQGISRLRDAETVGNFLLRQAGGFAQRVKPTAESGPFPFSWSTCIHAAIIRHGNFFR